MRNPSEIYIGKNTLEEILEWHSHWLNKDCEGWENMRADMRGADLRGANSAFANLPGADLCNADLRGADLSGADLLRADLSRADLRGAFLHSANLCNADLCDADLRGADLRVADLFRANLRGADLLDVNLSDANLTGANLSDAKNIPHIPLACPSDGAFIGWKKVKNNYLVKLRIPASAKRCSATTGKCRASAAKVLGIYTLDGKKTNKKNILCMNQILPEIDYIVGETIYPDSFDENRWHECSHGIHFFINKQDAINY